ncbi:MAG: TlpA disulfide reductase family protein [Gemmatimonadota bacterium]
MRISGGLLAASAAFWLAGCDVGGVGNVEVGGPAPGYSAVDLAGDSVRLSASDGRPVLLNVWATWCLPCRTEIPELQLLHSRYGANGLRVIGVSVDGRGRQEVVRQFAESLGVSYAIWHDPGYVVGTRFRTVGIPTTFLIDGDGVLRWRHAGPIGADDPRLNNVIEQALHRLP